MLVVGLTGGIASGKSTVSRLLGEKYHIPIIDADLLAREVIEPGTSGYKAVVKEFSTESGMGSASVGDVNGKDSINMVDPNQEDYQPGSRLIKPDGITLDRQFIASVVFTNPAKRHALNRIIHPRVQRAMLERIVKAWLRGEKVCVVDVPLLIETGLDKLVGSVVVVYVNDKLQLSRLLSRPSPNPSEPRLTSSQAQDRIRSQLPLSSKVAHADIVLDNGGSPADLENQVDRMVSKWMRTQSGWRWRLEWWFPPLGIAAAMGTLLWRAARRWRRKAWEARKEEKGR